MKKLLPAFFVILSIQILSAQYISGVTYPDTTRLLSLSEDINVTYAESINAEDMRGHLSVLASDDFQGRETGTDGIEKAAKYIASHFESLNLKPVGTENSYFQKVAFTWTRWEESSVEINGTKYKHLWDYLSFPGRNINIPLLETEEVIFLGYGIDDKKYSDYKKNDVTGKVIMIYSGEPIDKHGNSQITGKAELSDWSTAWEKKLTTAKEKGVRAVLIIQEDIKGMLAENRRKLLGGGLVLGDLSDEQNPYANSIYISSTMAKQIMGEKTKKVIKSRERSKKKGKACDIALPSQLNLVQNKSQKVLKGKNILGFIEGAELKDEIVVVSAHYDHIGMRGQDIYNGADDNGTGTTAVLEIAEALTKAKNEGNGPKRSVLCLLVTGEEKGLLGSQYYSEHPVFPLEQTVADVNIDMIGRVDKKYSENPNYIYVIGSDRLSSDLHNINEQANQKYARLILDYTYNDENDPNRYYFRSDHYNFARKGIPSIFYFSGVHEDYHRTTDTIEKINFDKMAKVARLIFHTTWELANRNDRIVVDGEIK